MYIPETFKQNDPAQLKELIQSQPFASLITHSDKGVEANHLPFILTQSGGRDVLQGHIAKANPLWRQLQDKAEVLVIFQGPDSYISPNYYPTKKDNGLVVPTWNYVAVHVRGVMSCIHDASWNIEMITRLTEQHEATQASAWKVTDAPKDFTEKLLAAIVGIEIEVLSISGKWKLSQNQPEKNIRGIIEGLSQENESNSQKMAVAIKDACGLNP